MPEGDGRAASYTESMKAIHLALAVLVCSVPLVAAAEWQWLDKDGRRVFSDQAPPPEVPPNRILKKPGMRAAVAPAPEAAAAAPVAAPAPRPSGKDKELETRKKQADAAAAAKKKAQDEQFAQAKADNCSRARSGKATFDSGVRVVRANEKGERIVMDDTERAAEVKRLDAIIASDCK
jgi:hypothetical protein